jgi:hypothetical protein
MKKIRFETGKFFFENINSINKQFQCQKIEFKLIKERNACQLSDRPLIIVERSSILEDIVDSEQILLKRKTADHLDDHIVLLRRDES